MRTAAKQALSLLTILSLGTALPTIGQTVHDQTHLVAEGDKVLLVQDGQSEALQSEKTLSNGYVVATNGVVTLRQGVEKKLASGQKLTLDGLLMTPGGRLEPLEDHVTLHKGKVALVQEGRIRPVSGNVALGDGSTVTANGWLIRPNGRRTRLLDGQMLRLDGSAIPSQDFVMIKQGRVVLQKDGALLNLPANRRMAMGDGTRVFGTGRLERPDGTVLELKEGQRINLPGPALNPAR